MSGKVFFEVKLLSHLETKLGEEEKNVHQLRVGFSTDDTDMMLGEALNSFAYVGLAKKGTINVNVRKLDFREAGFRFTSPTVSASSKIS